MTYCVNPRCAQPQNSLESRNCQSCGCPLLLKGKYGVVKELGIGGFGRTFLAIDYSHPNKQRCVVKQLFPDRQNTQSYAKTLELFQQEAQQLKYLGKHPQIPDCFESFGEGDYQYIIQEFVDGNDLNQQLKLSGLFTEAQIFNLLKEILPVLEFIHQKGIIHRDVKPANIIASQADGSLWLVDLGAAKQLTGAALAQTGTVIGSAEYTAPEQGRGKAIFASDIYSLGVTCIYLLTGVSPFSLYDTGDSRWVWRDFLPNNMNSALGPLLDKMIQMSTNKRYRTAQDVQADLVSINLKDSGSNHVEKTLVNLSTAPVPENQKLRFEKSQSSREQKYQIELQQEKQPAQLKVSVGYLEELTTAVADELVSFLSENLSHRQARTLLYLVSFSFIAFLIYTPATIRHTQRNSSNDLVPSEVTTTSSEDTSYESYLNTSADWHTKTYLYPTNFMSTAIAQGDSKIGFDTSYTSEVGSSFATWNLEPPASEPTLTSLDNMGLEPIGYIGHFNGEPLFIDPDKQLKALDILTGETSLISTQQQFSLDKLGISNSRGILIVNSTNSFAYYADYGDAGMDSASANVWNIKTAEPLTSQAQVFSSQLNWPMRSVSQDNIVPFSNDGKWLLLSNGRSQIFELWDLTISKKVKTIKADSVSFDANDNILIVESQASEDKISRLKLLDLNTQQYIFDSSKVKYLALHPYEKIAAIFDGEKVLIGAIENLKGNINQTRNLGDYPALQNLKFSPDGKVLAGRLKDESSIGVGKLVFWDTATGKMLGKPLQIGGLNIIDSPRLQFSPDGQTLLIKADTGNTDNLTSHEIFIQLWNVPKPLEQ